MSESEVEWVASYKECGWCNEPKKVNKSNFPKLKSGNYSSKCVKCTADYRREKYLKRRDSEAKTDRRKLTLEQAREIYKDNGAELLEDEFINKKSSCRYKCSCGNVHKKSMQAFIDSPKCPECHIKNLTPIEEVRKFYKSIGMEFLDDVYIRVDYPHKVMCVCGRIVDKTLESAKKGRLCWLCGVQKNTGSNSSRWNPELSEEDRVGYRSYPGYYSWRREVLKRDGYKCVKCKDSTRELHVHHIIPHSVEKEKRLEVSNGASLCVTCHRDIHKNTPLSNMNIRTFKEYIRKGECISE